MLECGFLQWDEWFDGENPNHQRIGTGAPGPTNPANETHFVAARYSPRDQYIKAQSASNPAHTGAIRHGLAALGG